MRLFKKKAQEPSVLRDIPLGERAAVLMTEAQGSWAFILAQNIGMATWVIANVVGIITCDKWPFQGLNLFMSAEAANATSIIIMAQRVADRILKLTLEQIVSLENNIVGLISQVFTLEKRAIQHIYYLSQLVKKVLRGISHVMNKLHLQDKKIDKLTNDLNSLKDIMEERLK